jgi:type IV secretion system protein VirB8
VNAPIAASAPAAYFAEAAAWDADRLAAAGAHARLAWRVATAGWICALGCAGALLALAPLKRVEPFLIRVDSSTGVVDVVPALRGAAGIDTLITRYFLSHYVAVCQRFNLATAESDYEECAAFHTAQRNQAWVARWRRSNPRSPLNLHRDGSQVRAQVQSVSFFRRASGATDLAQVRFLQTDRDASGALVRSSHRIATIQFAYTAPPEDPRLRRWNPLGFRILQFDSEPEVADEAPSGAGPTPPTGAP